MMMTIVYIHTHDTGYRRQQRDRRSMSSLGCQVILYQLKMEWFISYLYGIHTVYIRDGFSLNNEDKSYRKQLGSMYNQHSYSSTSFSAYRVVFKSSALLLLFSSH